MAKVASIGAAVAALLCVVGEPAEAALNRAGDPSAPPLNITFAAGQNCWRYTGTEAYFTGSFRTGQHLIITSVGEEHVSDAATGRTLIRLVKRDLAVSSVSGGAEVTALADDEFIVPTTGKYDITFWPHAIQGYSGMLVVCRR